MIQCPNTSRSGKIIFLMISILAALACHASGQQAPSADALFTEAKWEQAARAYTEITAKEPANGPAWQHLGECDIHLQRYDDALNAFQHVVDLKYRPLMTKVDMARVYVAKADTPRALDLLTQVVASGNAPRLRAYIVGASEFQELRTRSFCNPLFPATVRSTGNSISGLASGTW